ncbi:hypothetical protein B7P43_G17449 [Cryptotermes secundus]|uniref:Uncharacterized protein n=1 Tax=Cryptotermes secundus TaxID=105785 RepID=A0A2J7R4B3_9NEOP|nr:hypothetical protein B7P43_G17449 [Cryptotermes secundus]
MHFAADHSETLEVFLLNSVNLDVGFLDSTENVQTIFELLPCSVQHVRWNNQECISDAGLCSERTALDITPQEKTEVSKNLPEFHYDLPQTAGG